MSARRFRGMAAFWVTWGGLIASFTGSGLTRFGLSVWMYQETRDAQAFAVLLFFGVLPLSIGALIAGPLVDRLDRRRVLVVSNAVTRLPTLFVMVLWWQGVLGLWHDFVVGHRYVLERPAFLFLSVYLAIVVLGWGFVCALSGPIVLGLGNEATIGLMYAAFGTWWGPWRSPCGGARGGGAGAAPAGVPGPRRPGGAGPGVRVPDGPDGGGPGVGDLGGREPGRARVRARHGGRRCVGGEARALDRQRRGPGAALLQIVVGVVVTVLAVAGASSRRVRQLEDGLVAAPVGGRGGGRIVPLGALDRQDGVPRCEAATLTPKKHRKILTSSTNVPNTACRRNQPSERWGCKGST